MAKKKKMTPAQAAAARRDDRPKRTYSTAAINDKGPVDRGNRLVIVVTVVLLVLVAVVSFVFAVNPFGR